MILKTRVSYVNHSLKSELSRSYKNQNLCSESRFSSKKQIIHAFSIESMLNQTIY